MNWKWLQNVLAQWRANPRLRYAVLIVIVILSVHGVLKLADHRDGLVQDWTKDQDLLIRLKEVSAQPAWPRRAEAAESRLRDALVALPLARTRGQARAELHMWLIDLARQAGIQGYQVSIEDALDVPEQPGLMQVVGKLEASDLPWKLTTPLRLLARGLPWRQVQRMELTAGQPGRVSAIVRSYHRDGTVEIPSATRPAAADTPTAVVTAGAEKPGTGGMAAPAIAGSRTLPSAPAAASPVKPRSRRELPVPAAVVNNGERGDEGVVQGVLQPGGKPATEGARKEGRP